MIKSRLYKYDSTKADFKGEDFSRYIMIGDTTKDDLTEVMGTIELTLTGLPFQEEFAPETLFVYERADIDENGIEQYSEHWHMCVQQDLVSQPVLSDDNYYDHHITLQEASAIAQKRLVDNIAVTYRLQDITLEGELNIDTEQTVSTENMFKQVQGRHLGTYNQWLYDTTGHADINLGKKVEWEFATWFNDNNYPLCRGERSEWTNFKYYQPVPLGQPTVTINLPVPMLKLYNGVRGASDDNFYEMGYCSVRTVVTEIQGNKQTVIKDFITNPYGANNNNSHEKWTSDWFDKPTGEIINSVRLWDTGGEIPIWGATDTTIKVADYDNAPTQQTRRIIFEAKPDCTYNIKTFPSVNFNYEFNAEGWWSWFVYHYTTPIYTTTNSDTVCATIEFMTYQQGDNAKVQITSAPEQNAYELFQKAQITTQDTNKVNGVAINETPQTFYVDPNDQLELSNTRIVENFYNQKNLWELLLEIGKYIHSIPKIVFGENNRFMVTWQRLGSTEQFEDKGNKMSIFNNRSIENYISACSSYITNMVQLGGVIDEWVAPKSSSEDFLVYNDVAEIVTNKPIIEIVSMQAKCITSGKYTNTSGADISTVNNGIASLTPEDKSVYTVDNSVDSSTEGIYYVLENGNYVPVSLPDDYVSGTQYYTRTILNGYIFEESVYNIIDIDKNALVNKGIAIYYELGTNTIKGLNYRLPSVHNDSPYAITNILSTIFNIRPADFQNIMINDFIFHIVYRTKDTARSDQTRPDLRKYLLTSNYDRVPQHYQFNNQTDIVVDSNKFGNNIYGKLIRTGNAEYTKTEWVDTLTNTKHVGELYNIGGERYYVATVSNTNYGTHIISEITFSKDYNQLSEIIGIPSEPRFYEISERSIIDREKPFNNYIVLGTTGWLPDTPIESPLSFVRENGWRYLRELLFQNTTDFPKYAITVFKNDKDRRYGDVKSNNLFYKEVCHPISVYSIQNTLTLEWDMVDNFSAGDKVSEDITVPDGGVNKAYRTLKPTQYTDAYGRSDLVDFLIVRDVENMTSDQILNLPDSPLRTKFPFCRNYVGMTYFTDQISKTALTQFVQDTLGRSPQRGDGVACVLTYTNSDETLYVFCTYTQFAGQPIDWDGELSSEYLFNQIKNDEIDWGKKCIEETYANYLFGNESVFYMGNNDNGLALLKDSRETIHCNYNLQMITDSDRFVLSSWLWQPQKGTLKLALLDKEINKISNDTISDDNVIDDSIVIYDPENNISNTSVWVDATNGVITVPIATLLNGVDLTGVKALAIVSDNIVAENAASGARYFVMGRNISDLDTSDITGTLTPEQAKGKAKADWYVSNYDKTIFTHQ